MLRLIPLLFTLAVACGATRPVHTYSIVARDPQTGQIGVAVQSHWFSVGTAVAWAEAGTGAVATQSFSDPSYGMLGLQMMRSGKSAPEVLKSLLAGDEGRNVRQVAMVDAQGRTAAHTGTQNIQMAGHAGGDQFSVQANMMLKASVWPAMSSAFQAAKGDLAERMLQALEAAEAEGGDIRGRQSAALIVVAPQSTGKPWVDRLFDLRVEDHPQPLKELRRLVTLTRAYRHMNEGDLAMANNDTAAALREYSSASRLAPGNVEMIYWHAIALVSVNRVEEALPLFRQVFKEDRNWVELTRRLPKAGLLKDDAAILERIAAQAP